MFDKERMIATITVMSSFLLIVVLGLWVKNSVICIILLFVQFAGLLWYVSPMIPGLKKFCCCCCSKIKSAATAAAAV